MLQRITFFTYLCSVVDDLSHISETRPSGTKDVKAHSRSVSEVGTTNMGYLNQGEKKEENEEGKDKGQKGWQKKFFNHFVQR